MVGRKGLQRVGERLAKGWQRVGEGMAKDWERVSGFPCTLQFRHSRGARLETLVCDSMGNFSGIPRSVPISSDCSDLFSEQISDPPSAHPFCKSLKNTPKKLENEGRRGSCLSEAKCAKHRNCTSGCLNSALNRTIKKISNEIPLS